MDRCGSWRARSPSPSRRPIALRRLRPTRGSMCGFGIMVAPRISSRPCARGSRQCRSGRSPTELRERPGARRGTSRHRWRRAYEAALKLVGLADTIEEAMCGYRHDTEAIRPANEARRTRQLEPVRDRPASRHAPCHREVEVEVEVDHLPGRGRGRPPSRSRSRSTTPRQALPCGRGQGAEIGDARAGGGACAKAHPIVEVEQQTTINQFVDMVGVHREEVFR
jgi:hypothetical protein